MFLQIAYVGFTSDGICFYFSNLTNNSRLWIVVVAEHILLLFKVSLATLYPYTPTHALQIVLSSMVPTIDEKVMYDHEASM
jgi:hypothetical protein